MSDLDDDADRAFIDQLCALFRSNGATVHFVELYASLEERLRRNRPARPVGETGNPNAARAA